MVFSSFIFLCWFLPLFLPLYFAAPRPWRNGLLTVASFAFYGWWRPQYVLLMLGSVLIDHYAALRMGPPGSRAPRRFWLICSIAANLGLLGWFKYANLFVATWNDLAPWPVEWEAVLLPVGISFFTFQSMSYTIDVYRGDVPPTRSLLELLCYVSMFPQLVAGPIVRYSDIRAQLRARTTDLLTASDGAVYFALGLAKKVLIADSVGQLVDSVHALDAPGLVASWLAAFGYTLQLYFDFSGYSDMAIGLGLLMGLRFPPNFRSPYRAHSITEFWRRWHISLSTWLRDYLYIPLGGNRHGETRAQLNVAITMLLGGLWHGASWQFLLWGGWHGAFLVLERRLGGPTPYGRLPHVLQVALTFLIWTLSLVFFRCTSMDEVGQLFAGLSGQHGVGTWPALGPQLPLLLTLAATGALIAFFAPRSEQLVERARPVTLLGAVALFVLAFCQVLDADFVSFIYFQF